MPVANIPATELAEQAFYSLHRPLLGLHQPMTDRTFRDEGSSTGTTTTIEIRLDDVRFDNEEVVDYLTAMKAKLEQHQREQEKEEELTRGRKRKRQQKKKIMFFTPSKL
ncbi:hypothetical protein DFQ28_005902 [Apophysomyces sp. BC1034]|nr:hypothetical protein DFQ29_000864 [Apophysomyces sp. BC1021]KAG0187759.1 hypothetical protein DFQ28_005902 [Apophysomyces sp. BC1034]